MNLVKLKGKSIWEIDVKDSDCGTWKTILNLSSKIRDNVWYEVGNGKKINVWHDRWNEMGNLSEFVTYKNRYEASVTLTLKPILSLATP